MKNKKNQKKGKYLLGLLAGVVVLGVGYATISNISLNITGSASAIGSLNDNDFVVRFVNDTDANNTNNEVSSVVGLNAKYTVIKGENVTASASIENDLNAKFDVQNMVVDDEVKFTYYIANLSNGIDAKVTPSITNASSDNFEITINPVADTEFDLADGNVQKVDVTVKCISQDLTTTNGSFNISFTAQAVEE